MSKLIKSDYLFFLVVYNVHVVKKEKKRRKKNSPMTTNNNVLTTGETPCMSGRQAPGDLDAIHLDHPNLLPFNGLTTVVI